jgi:hypothetical protein
MVDEDGKEEMTSSHSTEHHDVNSKGKELSTPLTSSVVTVHTPVEYELESVDSSVSSNQQAAWKTLFCGKHEETKRLKRVRSPDPPITSKKTKASKADNDFHYGGPTGNSISAKSEMASRKDAQAGNWDPVDRENWIGMILKIDKNAEFPADDLLGVRCSSCRKIIHIKRKNEKKRFHTHYCECVKKKKGQRQLSLTQFVTKPPTQQAKFHTVSKPHIPQSSTLRSTSNEQSHTSPCPGLTGANHKRIPIYLDRSSTRGGGSRSIVDIADNLFGKTYRTLSDEQKDLVLETQKTEHTWVNDLEKCRIFSLKCTKIVSATKDGNLSPCLNCLTLLKSDERLRYVLKKPIPHEKNFKFINFRFRNRRAGLQYACIKGFHKLLEEAVSRYSSSISFQHKLIWLLGCRKCFSIHEVCSRCSRRKV